MIDFDKLIETSHTIAVEKGWWERGERSLDDQFNNFDAEIIEAWEEYRKGKALDEIYYRCSDCGLSWNPDQYPDEYGARNGKCICGGALKPEGFTVELADLLIRIADTLGAYGWKMGTCNSVYANTYILGASVSKFIRCIRAGLEEEGDSDEENLRWVIQCVIAFCKHHNLPLERALEEKTAYNRTRPYRHGNKKA